MSLYELMLQVRDGMCSDLLLLLLLLLSLLLSWWQ